MMSTSAASNKIRKRGSSLPVRLLAVSVILLVIVQVAAVFRVAGEIPVNIDALAAASKVCYEGRFLPGAPMMSLWGLIARMCGIHPMKLIFGIAPFIMIPLYYCIYYLAAGKLLNDPADRWFMMLCICLLNMWGYQSEYMIPYTMLCSWYTGTAFVVHGLLPLAVYLLADKFRIYYTEETPNEEYTEANTDDYYKKEVEDMKNHKIINARNLAVALLIVVIMLIGSVYIMNRKINSLYEVTVNLQQEIEEIKDEK